MKVGVFLGAVLLATFAGAAELKNGAAFSLDDVPETLTAHVKRGDSVKLLLEENATTGYQWEVSCASNACTVATECRTCRRDKTPPSRGLCGAPHMASFTITANPAAPSPALVEFSYRRSWETGVKPLKTVRLSIQTITERPTLR